MILSLIISLSFNFQRWQLRELEYKCNQLYYIKKRDTSVYVSLFKLILLSTETGRNKLKSPSLSYHI